MSILLAVVCCGVVLCYWMWRMQLAAKADCDAFRPHATVIQNRAAELGRSPIPAHIKLDPFDELSDPKDVAVLVMLETAKFGGDVTDRQQARIHDYMKSTFESNHSQTEEALVAVSYLRDRISSFSEALPQLIRPLRQSLTEDQRMQLISALQDIAGTGSNQRQKDLVSALKDKLIREH